MTVPGARVSALVICAAALALMAPELASGLSFSDSFRYNIVWTEQFADRFRGGDLYPRWLVRSWDGLGSPTFYFYPPLFFWAAALINVATFGALGTEALVSAASLLFLAASGLAMRAWLASFSGGRAPLIGALAFMAAPYHLYDIYGRGALAEASAYALLPLLMLGLRRLGEGRRGFVLLVALSYAALVMTHLPVALLVTVFVLPPYVLFDARRSNLGAASYLAQAFAGGVLGLALSAVYLVPALSLTGHISSAALFGGFYEPSNWFFWRPEAWPRKGPVLLTMAVSAGALLLALGAARAAGSGERREAFFWFGITAIAFVMASGVLPFLWELPFLAQVQFPSRMLPIAEFAAVTAMAIGRPRIREPLVFLGALPAIGALATAAGAVAHAAEKRRAFGAEEIAKIRADWRDAPEYLPAGFPIALSAEGVPESALIRLPEAVQMPVEPRRDGGARVTVESAEPATIVLRRFHFPHWRVTDEAGRRVPNGPSPDRLLSWRAEAGRSAFLVSRGAAPGERLGLGLSAAALLALALATLWLSHRNPRRR